MLLTFCTFGPLTTPSASGFFPQGFFFSDIFVGFNELLCVKDLVRA